ncbi:phosphatase PAP2 family protein [Streptomyces sp. NPDC059247]|uniref:phosphatase PAP2 family protein n=1 Tax=Streptomyces sp. NPDC059247 TaxID=3346790 RepID=UPI0036CD0D9D
MTQHISPPPTPTPSASPSPSARTDAGYGPGPGPDPAARSWLPPALCLLAFVALYLVAVCTPFGQRAENHLFSGEQGAIPAWVYGVAGGEYGSWALPPMEQTALPTLFVGTALIAAVAVLRRRWWQGLAAVTTVVVTIGAKELVSMFLPRPDLVGAEESLIESSFPSGHAAVPVALVLGALLVVPPRVRPYLATAGMLWSVFAASGVLATYHHRSSDSLGSTLLACACYLVAARLLPERDAPASPWRPRALAPVALAGAAAVALLSGARDDSLLESLVFAAAGFLCAVLFWLTTARGTAAVTGGPSAAVTGRTAP